MGFRLSPPVIETFTLDETDQRYGLAQGSTTVTLRQATQSQHERRQDLFSQLTSKMPSTGSIETIELIRRLNDPELARTEIYLTIIDCNIEDEDGKSLFKFSKDKSGNSWLDMNEVDFRKAFGKLPIEVAEEIHTKVLEVNKDWGPLG
jgi:hypothetical protein